MKYTFRINGDPVPNNTKQTVLFFNKRHERKLDMAAKKLASLNGSSHNFKQIFGILQSYLPAPKMQQDFTISNYKPAKVRDWIITCIEQLQKQAFNHYGDPFPLDEPLSVEYWIFLPRPKSVKSVWPATKPDYDNLIKPVQDALETAKLKARRGEVTITPIIANDSRIVESSSHLRYAGVDYPGMSAREPGIEIIITTMRDTVECKAMEPQAKLELAKASSYNDSKKYREC